MIKPLDDRVVVVPVEKKTTTDSGIIIPEVAQEKPQEGEVLAVGPGRYDGGVLIPMQIKVGDRVLHSKYGGVETTVDGQDVIILTSKDILAVLE